MRDLLIDGYTIYISKTKDDIQGIGLKKMENGKGLSFYELDAARLKVLGELPGINERLVKGETLQVSRNHENKGIRYKAQMGTLTRQGPYGEDDCLEVTTEAEDEEFLGAIILLNEASIKDNKVAPPKILVRKYGDATYK